MAPASRLLLLFASVKAALLQHSSPLHSLPTQLSATVDILTAMAKGEGNTKAGWRGDMVEARDDVFDSRDEMDAPKGLGRDAAVFRWSRVRENPGWVWVLVLFILAMPIGFFVYMVLWLS